MSSTAPTAVGTACRAPSVSMYFDQFGNVRACCQNTDAPMGNVTTQSIREIWDGAATRRIRDALARHDYSEGCGFCAWQVDQGDDAIAFARAFDDLTLVEESPRWPVQMEFSMTNSCNLQCVMCNGDWSSSIRAHREHRPPLPAVYGDEFFEELAEFLPHLRKVNLLGGEPFLGAEPLRVLDMLSTLDHPPDVAVTTNGTQWSPRIEAICERLPISFVLSLDGITTTTYEAIRVGADFDAVMANLDRFRSYAERHGTTVSLAHCLMRPNWAEFSQLLRFAEERGLGVGMNEVLFPAELSLFQLPETELAEIVASLEADPVARDLTLLRGVWDGQLDALRHRLDVLRDGVHTFVRPWSSEPAEQRWDHHAIRVLTDWAEYPPPLRLEVGAAGTTWAPAPTDFLERFRLHLATDVEGVLDALSARFDGGAEVERRYTDMLDDVVLKDPEGRDPLEFRVTWHAEGAHTTVLVSVRNHPTLPDDAWTRMLDSSRADHVVVLTCDDDERILGCDGPLAALGLEGAGGDLVGRTTSDVVEMLRERHGGALDIGAGPSGYVADSIVTFAAEAPEHPFRLRVMVDRGAEPTVMALGVLR